MKVEATNEGPSGGYESSPTPSISTSIFLHSRRPSRAKSAPAGAESRPGTPRPSSRARMVAPPRQKPDRRTATQTHRGVRWGRDRVRAQRCDRARAGARPRHVWMIPRRGICKSAGCLGSPRLGLEDRAASAAWQMGLADRGVPSQGKNQCAPATRAGMGVNEHSGALFLHGSPLAGVIKDWVPSQNGLARQGFRGRNRNRNA